MISIEQAALTEAQTAEYLGLSRATLRRARMQGQRDYFCPSPPYVKLGKAVRYLKCDLDRWLESHRVNGGSQNGKL